MISYTYWGYNREEAKRDRYGDDLRGRNDCKKQGINQVGGENNFRFLLFSGWKLNPFNVTTLQYLIAVEEPEIFVLTDIFGLWDEKHNLTLLRQRNFRRTFERLLQM